MKNLTDFRETVETSVDPRLSSLHFFICLWLPFQVPLTPYKSGFQIMNSCFQHYTSNLCAFPQFWHISTKKKRFSLYYLSRNVSMKKYLYATENTCRYFQYSLEVIPYFIYSNFFVVNADYFFYWSLFHETLSTIATSISHEPLAVHCMIYINCCVTLSSKE